MDILLNLLAKNALTVSETRPRLHPSGGLLAIAGPYAASRAMLTLAAHLAGRGSLQVLDGGNRFNAYIVARLLRQFGSVDLRRDLGRIRVARAFTCYQMAALIEKITPDGSPILVIDLLDTFYDESAPLGERRRLAGRCMQGLRRSITSNDLPGSIAVVSLRPPPPGQSDPTGLLEVVLAAADQVLYQDASTADPPTRTPGQAPAGEPGQALAGQLKLF